MVSPLAQSRLASDPISFKSIHSYTTVDIVRKLEQHHYEKEALDDAMSSAILNRFLDRLDSNRNFFCKRTSTNLKPTASHLMMI